MATIQNITALSTNSLQLSFTDLQQNIVYQLQEKVGNGSFVDIGDSFDHNTTSFTKEGLTLGFNQYSYRLASKDICQGNDAYSNTLYTVLNFQTSSNNAQNDISWTRYAGSDFKKYQLYRDGNLIMESENRSKISHRDTDVICKQEYCYRLEVISGNNHKTVSETRCIIAERTEKLPSATNLLHNSTGESIMLKWDIDNDKGIQKATVLRSSGNSNDSFVSSSLTSYTDSTVSTSPDAFCYRILLEDNCDNVSDASEPTCNIYLEAQKIDKDNHINWTNYVGSNGRPEYVIEVKNGLEDGIFKEIPISTDTSYVEVEGELGRRKSSFYRIRGEFAGQSSTPVYSNEVQVRELLDMQVPEAFSPNGDGLNDSFYPRMLNYTEFRIDIYNRWGTVVFSSEKAEVGWDGTFNGNDSPIGPYTYRISGKDEYGQDYEKKGMFNLVR